jgi:hypothetical protein
MSRNWGVLGGIRIGFWSAVQSSRDRREALRLAARPVVEALERRVLFTLAAPTDLTATAYAGEVDFHWIPPEAATNFSILEKQAGQYVTVGYTTVGYQPSNEYLFTNGYQGLAPSSSFDFELIASNSTDSSDPVALTVTTADPSAAPIGSSSLAVYTGQPFSLFATTNELDSPTFQVNFDDGTSVQPQTAGVDWGGISDNGSGGTFLSPSSGYGSASGIYSAPGSYDTQFSFTDDAGLTATTDFSIVVTNAPLTITATPVHAVAGENFNGAVGVVSTPDTALGASDFTGTIHWNPCPARRNLWRKAA